MFCNKCGNRNPLNSHFCRHCGARLDLPGAATQVADELYQVASGDMHPVYDEEKVRRLLERAFNLNEQGDPVGAIIACKEALAENPVSVSAHSFLGLLYERQGEREKAISQYETVLGLNPDSTADRENLDRLRAEMRRPLMRSIENVAATPLLAAIRDRKWPLSPYIRALPVVAAAITSILFMLLINFAVSPPAISGEKAGAAATDSAVLGYVQKGRDAFARGDLDGAERNLRTALLLSPNDSDVLYWLSRVNAQRNPGGVAGATNLAQNPGAPPVIAPPALPLAASNLPQPSAVPPTAGMNESAAGNPYSAGSSANANTRRGAYAIPPVPSSPWVAVRKNGSESNSGATPRDSSPFSPTENISPPLPSERRFSPDTHMNYRMSRAPASGDSGSSGNTDNQSRPSSAAPDNGQNQNDGSGFYYQRQGLQMERQHRYAEARTAFQKALQAYREQKDSGIRVREAEEGMKTCEIAVRLCNVYLGG